MEYVFFDFAPFGGRTKVSSLVDFVSYMDCFDCKGFNSPHVYKKVCKDITLALEYLHGKMVAHRDMKPANVLGDNKHYQNLSGAAIESA